MDELIQEMDSLFKQVVKYYPMNDIKETKKQWNDLVEAVAKQSKQQSNCNKPAVSGSLREKELNGYLEEINNLMWNTWGIKYNKFDREEGDKIMVILERWASNDR